MRLVIFPLMSGLLGTLSTSCSMLGSKGREAQELKGFKDLSPDSASGDGGGSGLRDLGDVQPVVAADPSLLPDESKIVWADEDPDVPMTQLEGVWQEGPKESWYESYTEAMREARKEGKPVLLWFTNSKSNTACRQLTNELFSKSDFDQWATENLIRLRVDSNIQDDDENIRAKKQDYINQLRKQYKVMGAPVVVMLSPRGSQFGKYNGYKSGDPQFYFGRLKQSHRNAMADYANWRQEYEAKGYRMWQDHKGRKVFAKPVSLKDGELGLKEPDGKRSKTKLSKLSSEDRAWVEDYIAKRKRQ